MNLVKINEDTLWHATFDSTIVVGDYVQLTRKYSGVCSGIWKVIELNRVFIDITNAQSYAKIDHSRRDRQTFVLPTIGMEMVPKIKIFRVMDELYESYTRKDRTTATLDEADKVTPKFIATVQKKYDARTKNLASLLSGTW